MTWNMPSIPCTPRRWGWTWIPFWFLKPDTGEQALEIAEALIRSGAVDIVVIDSVAALVPRAEIEGIWETVMSVCRRV